MFAYTLFGIAGFTLIATGNVMLGCAMLCGGVCCFLNANIPVGDE